jgi:hypothetical protein
MKHNHSGTEVGETATPVQEAAHLARIVFVLQAESAERINDYERLWLTGTNPIENHWRIR